MAILFPFPAIRYKSAFIFEGPCLISIELLQSTVPSGAYFIINTLYPVGFAIEKGAQFRLVALSVSPK